MPERDVSSSSVVSSFVTPSTNPDQSQQYPEYVTENIPNPGHPNYIVARAAWMGPRPRCIHSSGVMRSSLVKIWSLNDENAQLSTCGAGSAVIALSSFPAGSQPSTFRNNGQPS